MDSKGSYRFSDLRVKLDIGSAHEAAYPCAAYTKVVQSFSTAVFGFRNSANGPSDNILKFM